MAFTLKNYIRDFVEVLLNLINSKKEYHIWSSRSLLIGLNKHFPPNLRLNIYQVNYILKAQRKYLVFKRATARGKEYLFVKHRTKWKHVKT